MTVINSESESFLSAHTGWTARATCSVSAIQVGNSFAVDIYINMLVLLDFTYLESYCGTKIFIFHCEICEVSSRNAWFTLPNNQPGMCACIYLIETVVHVML